MTPERIIGYTGGGQVFSINATGPKTHMGAAATVEITIGSATKTYTLEKNTLTQFIVQLLRCLERS